MIINSYNIAKSVRDFAEFTGIIVMLTRLCRRFGIHVLATQDGNFDPTRAHYNHFHAKLFLKATREAGLHFIQDLHAPTNSHNIFLLSFPELWKFEDKMFNSNKLLAKQTLSTQLGI